MLAIDLLYIDFFDYTGICTEGFALARQALCHLSHTAIPFRSGYFGNRVLLFAQAILHCDSPILHFPLLLG
jgi:hypothetical protein